MIRPSRRLAACVIYATVLLAAAQLAAADARKAAIELRAKYATDVRQLAKWCEEHGLADEAKQTLHVLGPSDPLKLYVPVLPVDVGSSAATNDASDKGRWLSRLNKLRHDHALALFEMARRAVKNGGAGLAFDLAVAAAEADPDYEPARRLFGYQKYHGQWRTLYDVKKLRGGMVWNDKFGWLPKSHLRRYEDGQRYYDGKWITAADDAQRHRDIRSGWDVETEHYTIRTNHSIEAGVALGVKLEQLVRLWQQLFIRYYASQADVVALFEGRAKPLSITQRHDVVYFRDRDDYNSSLRGAFPNIATTIGVYVAQTRRAYFFAGKDSDTRTLFHEATHQLFHESRIVAPDVGLRANFWIVEGIAMYMESLRQKDGFFVLGGFDDDRMHAARYRLLQDRFYVPFKEFSGYGMERIQKDPRIRSLYSQAAGLANFLVHYEGGRYRDALVAYLAIVYSGRDDPGTLAKLTGASYSDLDKQYRQFMENKGLGARD